VIRTRLPDIFTEAFSVPGRHGRLGRGAATVPLRLITPSQFGDWQAITFKPYPAALAALGDEPREAVQHVEQDLVDGVGRICMAELATSRAGSG
jgi:hypothetical protein